MNNATARKVTSSYIDGLHLKPRIAEFDRTTTKGIGDQGMIDDFLAALPGAPQIRADSKALNVGAKETAGNRLNGQQLFSRLSAFDPKSSKTTGLQGDKAQETVDDFLASLPEVPEIRADRPTRGVAQTAKYTL